jgi:hypothetical protein
LVEGDSSGVNSLVGVGLVRAIRQARRERRWTPILSTAWSLLAGSAVVYLAFLGCWGLNYRRVPMSARLGVVAQPTPTTSRPPEWNLDGLA